MQDLRNELATARPGEQHSAHSTGPLSRSLQGPWIIWIHVAGEARSDVGETEDIRGYAHQQRSFKLSVWSWFTIKIIFIVMTYHDPDKDHWWFVYETPDQDRSSLVSSISFSSSANSGIQVEPPLRGWWSSTGDLMLAAQQRGAARSCSRRGVAEFSGWFQAWITKPQMAVQCGGYHWSITLSHYHQKRSTP